MPASYANFYVGHRSVLMPVYRDPCDDRACAIVGACFPDRTVVPIDCRELIVGLGALHCLTQQVATVTMASVFIEIGELYVPY